MLGKHSTTDPRPVPFAISDDILGMMQDPASSALPLKALRVSTGDSSAPAVALLVVISSQDWSVVPGASLCSAAHATVWSGHD